MDHDIARDVHIRKKRSGRSIELTEAADVLIRHGCAVDETIEAAAVQRIAIGRWTRGEFRTGGTAVVRESGEIRFQIETQFIARTRRAISGRPITNIGVAGVAGDVGVAAEGAILKKSRVLVAESVPLNRAPVPPGCPVDPLAIKLAATVTTTGPLVGRR